MSVSLQDALGLPPPVVATKPGDKPQSVGLSEALGLPGITKDSTPAKPNPPAAGLWGAFHDHIDSAIASQYKNAGEALDRIRQGKRDMLSDPDDLGHALPTTNFKGVGEGLLGLMNYVLSPMQSAVDEVFSKPSSVVVNKLASLVPAKPDLKSHEPRSGVDWAIRQSDVEYTSKGINEFMETLYNTAAGFMGGGGLKATERGAFELLTPEAKAEVLNRRPRAEAKISSAFDELAATDPEGAKAVTAKVETVDPRLAKFMAKRWDKFVNASEADLNEIGQKAADLRIQEMEGDFDKLKGILVKDQHPEALRVGQGVASPTKRPSKGGPSGYGRLPEPAAEPRPEPVAKELGAGMGVASPTRTRTPSAPSGYGRLGVESDSNHPESLSVGSGKSSPTKNPSRGGPSNYGLQLVEGIQQEVSKALATAVEEPKVEKEPKAEVKKFPKQTVPGSAGDFVKEVLEGKGTSKIKDQLADPEKLASYMDKNAGVAEAWSMDYLNKNWKAEVEHSPGYSYPYNVVLPWERKSFKNELEARQYAAKENKRLKEYLAKEADKRQKKGIPADKSVTEHNLDSNDKPPGPKGSGPKNQRGQLNLDAFNVLDSPAARIVSGKLTAYYDSLIRHINPEALGEDAKRGAAIIAKGIAGLAHEDSVVVHKGEERIRYWESQHDSMDFIHGFEKGESFKNPIWQKAKDLYERKYNQIVEQDRKAGVVNYEPEDHYLPHLYKDPESARKALAIKYGPSWTRPGFTKDRGFNSYMEALEEGKKYVARGEKNPFEPKFKNPEMIYQARQHASDLAKMKIEILGDLETHGLAVKKAKGVPAPGPEYSSMPSPAGGSYWVKNDAYQVLYNAFNSKTLWNMEGLTGDIFRAAMMLKNAKVQSQLGLSLYHFLHIGLGMDSSTEMVRATKELLAGATNPVDWFKRVVTSPAGAFTWNNRQGARLMRAFRGEMKEGEMTSYDKLALRLAAEGGFIPEMSSQYRTNAINNFRRALAAGSYKAAWHLPFAVMELQSKWMFDHWIPNLKFASYIKDAQTALKLNPELVKDDMTRMLQLRKIAKSVDNRYGQMAYQTMFWQRWVKDIAVANTLSLGWQMGLVRELGGGMLDTGHVLTREGSVAKKATSGMLDRPLMIGFYTGQALGIGGLMTWAMTGEPPKELKDYYLPRTGEVNPDKTPSRVNTMFYTKEIAGLAKHIETQGVAGGLQGLVSSKASGLIGLATEGIRGVDEWGDEIRRQGDTLPNQIGQTLSAMAPELEPISITAINKQPGVGFWDKLSSHPGASTRAITGFTPAPKYMTESKLSGQIDQIWKTYNAPKQTPYEKAEYSKEARELKALHQSGDMNSFDQKLHEIQKTYELSSKETRKLRSRIEKGSDPDVGKFKEFTWQQQKKLLDSMTPEERKKFLPHSNKEHLKYHYHQPEEVQ